MSVDRFDLEQLLHPISCDEFFRTFWEQKPLAIHRNDPGYFAGLFSLRDVDDVIAFTRPKFVEPADFLPEPPSAARYVQGWLAEDEPSPPVIYPGVSEVHQAFERGKTVILLSMHYRWPAVAALARHLDGFFGCPVHINLYLTPKGAQGFSTHHDGHEVFVLQLEGTKHWRFYGPARELPLADEDGPVAKDQLGPPTQEAFVQPGDVLYMPRGHVHEAFTSDTLSMHLTVGIKVYRWVDLLREALDAVSRKDVRFRHSLPPGLLIHGKVTEELTDQFHDLLDTFAESTRLEEAIHRLGNGLFRKLGTLPANYFSARADAERLQLDSVVERAPGTVCRVIEGDGWAGIEYPGQRVDGPSKIASALRFMTRTPRFVVQALPDDLTSDAKLTLVRRLVRTRFLILVPPDGPPAPGS